MRIKFKLHNEATVLEPGNYRQHVLKPMPVKENDSKCVFFSWSFFEYCPLNPGRYCNLLLLWEGNVFFLLLLGFSVCYKCAALRS